MGFVVATKLVEPRLSTAERAEIVVLPPETYRDAPMRQLRHVSARWIQPAAMDSGTATALVWSVLAVVARASLVAIASAMPRLTQWLLRRIEMVGITVKTALTVVKIVPGWEPYSAPGNPAMVLVTAAKMLVQPMVWS